MTLKELIACIEADCRFDIIDAILGKTPESDELVVKNLETGNTFAISVDFEPESTWKDYEGVLLGQRQPRIMTQVTRIVGYYSFVHNWNRSKLAELADRHQGNYGVPGV